MASVKPLNYIDSDSDDEIKSTGPGDDTDDELIVEDNDYTVDVLGYDMKTQSSVARDVEKRNKEMHNKKQQHQPAELAESSDDEDLVDSDNDKSDSDSDFSAEGLELISDMPKPDKSGKVTLVVDGSNGEHNEEENECCSDEDAEKAGSDCEEKCSDDEDENDPWLDGKHEKEDEDEDVEMDGEDEEETAGDKETSDGENEEKGGNDSELNEGGFQEIDVDLT